MMEFGWKLIFKFILYLASARPARCLETLICVVIHVHIPRAVYNEAVTTFYYNAGHNGFQLVTIHNTVKRLQLAAVHVL